MTNLTCVSLAIGYPTIASVPHVIVNGFKNLLAIAAATDVEFKEAETVCIIYCIRVKVIEVKVKNISS